MAVVWAKSAGNWSTASLWAFWNESTQQIEDYGQTPQVGDIVYCNGYIIQTNGLNVQLTIRNDENPYTGIQGGHIGPQTNWVSNTTFTIKAFYCGNENLISNNSANTYFHVGLRFNCDVYILETGTFCYKAGSNQGFSWTINGNVYAYGNGGIFNDGSYNSPHNIINGNVISYTNTNGSITRSGTENLTINGNVVWNGVLGGNNVNISGSYSLSSVNISLTTLKVYGNVAIGHLAGIGATTFNYYGDKITYYDDSYNIAGLKLTTFNIYSDNFQWINLSEPRTLKYIILTDADMNNTDQYPSPANVKKDVPYAWGELVGQYLPDYPPETVVLKDYVYDGGEMVGTYEGGGTVQNTINVYPYKRRNH